MQFLNGGRGIKDPLVILSMKEYQGMQLSVSAADWRYFRLINQLNEAVKTKKSWCFGPLVIDEIDEEALLEIMKGLPRGEEEAE